MHGRIPAFSKALITIVDTSDDFRASEMAGTRAVRRGLIDEEGGIS